MPFRLIAIFLSIFCAHTICAQTDSMAIDEAQLEISSDSLVQSTDESTQKQGFFTRLITTFDDTDSSYIEPNFYNYAFMLQNTNFYQSYNLRATTEIGDKTQRISLSPATTFRVGPYFGWRWLFFGYTFDVSRPQKAGKATQFNISLYSARLGVDFVCVKNNSNFYIERIRGFDDVQTEDVKDAPFFGMNTRNLSLNMYYVFNHRRFSYPAAYSQSTVQRRSAGSWMLGLRFDRSYCSFDYTRLPEILLVEDRLYEGFKGANYNHRNYSISFGYAYNWVPVRNLLISLSTMPSLGYRLQKGEHFELDRQKAWTNVKNLNIDFVNRAAIVWNNGRFFCGGSIVNYLYNYRAGNFGVTNALTYFNVYAGVNFWRRTQYRIAGKSKW